MNIMLYVALIILVAIVGSIILMKYVWKRKRQSACNEETANSFFRIFGVWIFIFVIGFICTGVGTGIAVQMNMNNKGWEDVSAIVSYEGASYESGDLKAYKNRKVRVTYTYAGVEYKERTLNYKNSSLKPGDSLDIMVNTKNPNVIQVHTFYQRMLYAPFLVVGILFLSLSVIGYYSTMKKTRRINTGVDLLEKKYTSKSISKIISVCVVLLFVVLLYVFMPFSFFLFIVVWLFIGIVMRLAIKKKKKNMKE